MPLAHRLLRQVELPSRQHLHLQMEEMEEGTEELLPQFRQQPHPLGRTFTHTCRTPRTRAEDTKLLTAVMVIRSSQMVLVIENHGCVHYFQIIMSFFLKSNHYFPISTRKLSIRATLQR